MSAFRTGAALLLLAGCSNDAKLAELEAKQKDLRTQYDQTAASVAEMRGQLEAMGVLDKGAGKKKDKGKAGGAGSGKKSAKFGNPVPKTEISKDLGIVATRTGALPALPVLSTMERIADKACGWKYQIKEYSPISDYNLNSLGLGRSGPVVLLEDGKPLAAHAAPSAYEDSCSGAFRHAGYLVMFSPKGNVDAVQGKTYTLGLDDRLPMPRGEDGREIYWVYPGTTLKIETKNAWNAAWGALDVDMVPRPLAIEGGGTGAWSVTIAGQAVELPVDKEAPQLHQTLDPVPTGSFAIEISSPADGPYVVLETLTLGNADHAAVVTSEAAFRAAKK